MRKIFLILIFLLLPLQVDTYLIIEKYSTKSDTSSLKIKKTTLQCVQELEKIYQKNQQSIQEVKQGIEKIFALLDSLDFIENKIDSTAIDTIIIGEE